MSENPDVPEVDEPDVDSPEETDQPDTDNGKPEPEPFDEDRAKAKIAKANQEAKNLRARLKELEPLAAKAKELEDANKTEAEKLSERATAAEQRAQEAELRLMRLEVAADKGLTPAQAKRLVGATREEMEADADDLLATFGPKTDPPPKAPRVPGKPTPRLRGGGDPDEEPEETDPRKLADLIRRG